MHAFDRFTQHDRHLSVHTTLINHIMDIFLWIRSMIFKGIEKHEWNRLNNIVLWYYFIFI